MVSNISMPARRSRREPWPEPAAPVQALAAIVHDATRSSPAAGQPARKTARQPSACSTAAPPTLASRWAAGRPRRSRASLGVMVGLSKKDPDQRTRSTACWRKGKVPLGPVPPRSLGFQFILTAQVSEQAPWANRRSMAMQPSRLSSSQFGRLSKRRSRSSRSSSSSANSSRCFSGWRAKNATLPSCRRWGTRRAAPPSTPSVALSVRRIWFVSYGGGSL